MVAVLVLALGVAWGQEEPTERVASPARGMAPLPQAPVAPDPYVGDKFVVTPTTGSTPSELSAEWLSAGGAITLVLRNDSAEVVELVWDSSAFAGSDGRTVGVVPGETRVIDVRRDIPNSVVLPGTRLETTIIREDQVEGTDVTSTLITMGDVGGEVTLSMALIRGEEKPRLTQFFTVATHPDLAVWRETQVGYEKELAAYNAEVAALEAAAEREAERRRLAAVVSKHKSNAMLWAGGGLAGAALFGGMAAMPTDQDWQTEDKVTSGVLAVGSLGAGGLLWYMERSQVQAARQELDAFEAQSE